MNNRKIIIVGGNAAGPAAAAKAKRTSPDSEVILFESSPYISTGTCELPYVLSNEIDNYEKIVFFDEESFKEKKGVKVYTLHKVEKINRREKVISVRNLKENCLYEFSYEKLILATGALPKKIPSLDYSIKNVFSLKTVEDVIKIQSYNQNYKIKNALIIGSGYIGLEAAESFKKLNCDVTIIEMAPLPLPSSEPEIQHLIKEEIISSGVNFICDVKNTEFFYENNSAVRVKADGRIIDVDIVLSAIGFTPNNQLAIQSRLSLGDSGAIKVDKKLQTSDQHIYAAGDNCEVVNFITGKSDYIPLATYARDNGHIAGNNAAGGNSFAQPVVKNIGVRIFNKYFASAGLTFDEAIKNGFKAESEIEVAYNIIKVMPGSSKVFGKLVYEKQNKRILGASFWGGKEVAGYADMISMMIKGKQTADLLSEINYNYSPPLSPFTHLLSILGRKIKK